MPTPVLTEIRVAADPAAWAAAGFTIDGERARVGVVAIEFVPGAGGVVDWALTEVRSAGIDGLPTRVGTEHEQASEAHANGVVEIDHLVVLTPRLERTVEAFEAIGVELRRLREGETGLGKYRQAFLRLGRPILELVESADLAEGAPARFWGITLTTADLDAAAELLGEKLGRVKDAVQPGRRIATVRAEAGLGLPVALISAKG